MIDYHDRNVLDPTIRSGTPIIRGTRITVADIVDYLAGGMSPPDIVADFSDLHDEDLRAVLTFATDREGRLYTSL